MDQLGYHSSDLSVEAERKVARTFMGRIEWEMIVIGLGQFTLWIATWVLVIVGTIPLYAGFLIALFGAGGFLISGSYLKTNLPFSIGFLNVPAFLIFIPITTFMARIGARTAHRIDKNKISKLLAIFLLFVAVKFFYEYIKL